MKLEMKCKALKFCLLSFLFPFCLFSENWEIKARVAYFHPNSSRFREIYGEGLAQYQLEYGYKINDPWSVWGNMGFSNANGYSIGAHDRTNFHLWPFSTGIKYSFCKCGFEPYLGIGGSYSYVKMHDHSPYVIEYVDKKSFGVVGKAGIYYQMGQCIFLDVFADYYYTRFHFSGTVDNVVRNSLDMSGFLLGGGLGYQF